MLRRKRSSNLVCVLVHVLEDPCDRTQPGERAGVVVLLEDSDRREGRVGLEEVRLRRELVIVQRRVKLAGDGTHGPVEARPIRGPKEFVLAALAIEEEVVDLRPPEGVDDLL